MKKEVILVPKDKCPLDVLAEMGERIRKSWIFLHENVNEHLLKSEGASSLIIGNRIDGNERNGIAWKATREKNQRGILCYVPTPRGWGKIISISAKDIAYGCSPDDPEDIYFLKMDE